MVEVEIAGEGGASNTAIEVDTTVHDTIMHSDNGDTYQPNKASALANRNRRPTTTTKKRKKLDKWLPDTVTVDQKSPLCSYNIKVCIKS